MSNQRNACFHIPAKIKILGRTKFGHGVGFEVLFQSRSFIGSQCTQGRRIKPIQKNSIRFLRIDDGILPVLMDGRF
ncbi:uncharacterized protein METZ01_LOCUS291342, partial [marine metagenome]